LLLGVIGNTTDFDSVIAGLDKIARSNFEQLQLARRVEYRDVRNNPAGVIM